VQIGSALYLSTSLLDTQEVADSSSVRPTISYPAVLSLSMTFEERIDRMVERHEALTQTVELLAIETRELRSAISQDADNIRALVRIAEIHERRITHLEGGEPQ